VGLHDVATVAGVTEACRYNDHSMCTNPSCGCDCHKKASIEASQPIVEQGPEKACPKCGSKRPFNETYCRIDGERLASLLCGVCGAGMNPEDNYCYSCGGPKGAVGQAKVVTVPEVEIPVAGYEAQVLRGLQEELGNVQQPMDNQTVVETPAGPGTSFKLVSAPNPNKLRTPKPPVSAGTTPVRQVRLPVKPS
jgi:hypothetical protein